jgi:diketogulonate reductase-like aldo/keto reductase
MPPRYICIHHGTKWPNILGSVLVGKMTLTIQSRVRLRNGVEMPVLGLGTYRIEGGRDTYNVVTHALRSGYRLIDTAQLYGNEKDVGDAVRDSGLDRSEVFVATKLQNCNHGYERALASFERSVSTLGIDHIDLFLIHWPVKGIRGASWKALEKLYDDGRCKAIGVSNYTVKHLRELENDYGQLPMVDQVELSPYLSQIELREYCQEKNIVIQAYSPLTRGKRFMDPALLKIAVKHARSPAQVLIRWSLQIGAVPLPKSVHPARIDENAAVFDFELSDEDMAIINMFNEDLHVSWDPSFAP